MPLQVWILVYDGPLLPPYGEADLNYKLNSENLAIRGTNG